MLLIYLNLSLILITLNSKWCIHVIFFHSERCRYTMCGHEDSVNSTEFLPFSNTALTRSADKTLSLWDARMVSSLFLGLSWIQAKWQHVWSEKNENQCKIKIESKVDVAIEYSLTQLLSSDQKYQHVASPWHLKWLSPHSVTNGHVSRSLNKWADLIRWCWF